MILEPVSRSVSPAVLARRIARRLHASGSLLDPETAGVVEHRGDRGAGFRTRLQELASRYATSHARRLAEAGTVSPSAIAGEAARVRGAVNHAALVEAAVNPGGGPAVELLWNRVRAEVRALARAVARQTGGGLGFTGDDFEQEAFLKFRTSLAGFDPYRGTFRTYLGRVLRHHFVGLSRRSRVREKVRSFDPTAEPSAADRPDHRRPDPGVASADRLWRADVVAAVDELCWRLVAEGYPADRMRAFRLRRLGGLRFDAVAFLLGRSVAWAYQADLATENVFAGRFRAAYPGLVRDVLPTHDTSQTGA